MCACVQILKQTTKKRYLIFKDMLENMMSFTHLLTRLFQESQRISGPLIDSLYMSEGLFVLIQKSTNQI